MGRRCFRHVDLQHAVARHRDTRRSLERQPRVLISVRGCRGVAYRYLKAEAARGRRGRPQPAWGHRELLPQWQGLQALRDPCDDEVREEVVELPRSGDRGHAGVLGRTGHGGPAPGSLRTPDSATRRPSACAGLAPGHHHGRRRRHSPSCHRRTVPDDGCHGDHPEDHGYPAHGSGGRKGPTSEVGQQLDQIRPDSAPMALVATGAVPCPHHAGPCVAETRGRTLRCSCSR